MDAAEREGLVCESIDGWNADDWERRLESIWSVDGQITAPEGWPEPGTSEGWEAMVQQWLRIKDAWVEKRVELTSTETYGKAVLATLRWRVRGEASGAPLEVHIWGLYEFANGRIAKLVYFMDGEAARAAAEEAP